MEGCYIDRFRCRENRQDAASNVYGTELAAPRERENLLATFYIDCTSVFACVCVCLPPKTSFSLRSLFSLP